MNYQHFERFADLRWLLPLAGLHLLLFVQLWWWQRRQFDAHLLKRFGPSLSILRLSLKWALWTAAAVCLVYALAVPLGPAVKMPGDESGADIIMVVDVSSSMHAPDAHPDRLGELKQALADLIDRLAGDRVGLVAFAGQAVIACPLTSDSDTLDLFLSKLDTDSAPMDGTGLGPALKLALDGFLPDPKRGRVIILGTDGEDTSDSDSVSQTKRAALAGIPIITLGVGTTAGSLIPGQRDLFGNVYAKTYKGQPVHTKLDRDSLQRIAAASGGIYVEGNSAAGISAIYDRIRQLKQGMAKGQDKYTREPLFQKPLLWAFWLLVLEALISARGHGWLKLWQRLQKAFGQGWQASSGRHALWLGLLLLPGLARGSWDDGRSDYNQGNHAYRQGDYSKAADAYQQSLGDGTERPDSYYNLGNAKFQGQDYQGAIESYENALRLDPKDADAQHNLGLARQKLEEQQKQGSKKGKGDKDGKKDGKGPGKEGQGDGQGQGKPGPGQAQGQGKGQGQPQVSARQKAAQQSLNQDQVQAMMNQLRLDQNRYAGAFNPTKKFNQNQLSPEDQMRQQMGLPPLHPPQPGPGGGDRKDW
jgi:Ca-activated chloride channel family protein